MRKELFTLGCLLSLILVNVTAQVNLQTGAAQFGVPLYSFSDPANRLNLSAALNYVDGNGLKVNEVAAQTGTGWSLDCGGFIARIQHGEPDDQKRNATFAYPATSQSGADFLTYVDSYYPNGYLYSEYAPGTAIDSRGGYTPLFNCLVQYKPFPEYMADREQDVFVFNFNGKQGQFVIGKNMQVKNLVDNNFKITFETADLTNQSIRTTINKFTVTDENGIRYVFEEKQLDEICTSDRLLRYNKTNGTAGMLNGQINEYVVPNTLACSPNAGQVTSTYYRVYKSRPRGQYVVNKWLLTEISNPFTGKKITFNYTTYDVDYDADVSAALNSIDGNEEVLVTIGRVRSKAKRLNQVVLPGNQSLDFIYNTADRVDLANDKALARLAIKYNGNVVGGWDFTYRYFTNYGSKGFTEAFAANEKPYARLCLQQLQRFGKNNAHEQPYIFNYFLGDPNVGLQTCIPGRFSFFQDHWGYSNYSQWGNGIFIFNSYGAEPSPDGLNYFIESYLKNDLKSLPALKTPYNQEAKNGILKSIQYPLGSTMTFDYEQNTAWYNNQNTIAGGVRVSKTTENDGQPGHDIVKVYNYTREDGQSSSGWGLEPFTYSRTSSITMVRCDNSPKTAGAYFREAGAMFINTVVNIANTSVTGGLFAITTTTLESAAASVVTALVLAVVAEIIIGFFSSSDDEKTSSGITYHNFAMESSNSLVLQYARVEIVDKLVNSDVGKTVYEFTDESFRPVDIPALAAPYSGKQRYAHWLYGLPWKVTVFDNTGTPVKRTEYDYIKNASNFTDNNFLSRAWIPDNTLYGCVLYPFPGTNNTSVIQETYSPFVGNALLQETRDYLYKNATEFNVVTNDFEYNSKNLLSKKSTSNSKGELVETIYHYPFEYTAAGAIQTMNDANNNIVAPVIATETYITKPGNQKYLLGGSTTEFYTASNGDVKPWKSYSFRGDQPVLNTSLAAFDPSQVVRDASYFKLDNVFYYSVGGQMTQLVSEGNKKVATIYDDDGQTSIASVVNASASTIAFTSFEPNATGGWVFPADAVSSTAYLTGKTSYAFAAGRFTTIEKEIGSSDDKALRISFWAKGNAPYVFNSSASSGPVDPSYTYSNAATGWTYYEYAITGRKIVIANAVSGGSTGNFIIDELRLYPAGSRMVSYTYDPLVGKTSECDQANHITYYKYDDLGRLTGVLDQDKNLIKTYEYNYKQ